MGLSDGLVGRLLASACFGLGFFPGNSLAFEALLLEALAGHFSLRGIQGRL